MEKIILISFAMAISLGFAEKCEVYRQGETLPAAPLGGRECFQVFGDTNIYCIEFDCPTPECPNPVTPGNACPYCSGTCVDGGKIYQWGESYTCPDRCNTCSCLPFGGGISTQRACFLTKPPAECQ